jgi:hypothetical protein
VVINQAAAELQGAATLDVAPVVAGEADFETRWAAWVARGHVHERRVRRRLFVSAGAIAIGAAIAFAFFR